jgi:hypothetical protein
MRLYRLPKAAGIDSLTMAEADVPTPGRGQVLVRMRAASLNYRDLMIVSGRAARGAPPADLVPLSDGAGEVTSVGPEVTRVKPGDRVAGCFMQSWIGGPIGPDDAASSLGGAIDGVLAEYCLFDQNGLVHLPAHLSFEQGATLPCAGVTAWNALFAGQTMFPGDSVLVLGTGGVSVFALQLAVAAGFIVVATSSSDEKLASGVAGSGGRGYRWRRRTCCGGRRARNPGTVDHGCASRRGDRHDRRLDYGWRNQPRHGDAQRAYTARDLCRVATDVRGNEPRDHGASAGTRRRSGVRIRPRG